MEDSGLVTYFEPDMPTFHIDSPLQDQSPSLSNEDFDSLLKAVQLLRIAQLRYIVQKFSIPASGNKTKLLSLVISIFQGLRHDKVLIDIFNEINQLLSQQQESFANPFANMVHLEICQTGMDPTFQPIPNPLLDINLNQFVLGPIAVPQGQGTGTFAFTYNGQHSLLFNFMFQNSQIVPFSCQFEVNGFAFEIFESDPFPQPIDLTHVIQPINTINIRNINTSVPMMISVNEYRYIGIQHIVARICGTSDHLRNVTVTSNICDHSEFLLVPFLSKAFASQNWDCPICGKPLTEGNLQYFSSNGISEQPLVPPPQAPTMPAYPQQAPFPLQAQQQQHQQINVTKPAIPVPPSAPAPVFDSTNDTFNPPLGEAQNIFQSGDLFRMDSFDWDNF